jgi:hypothetical protein
MRRKQTKVRGKRRSHEAGKFQVHYAIMKTKLRHFSTMLVLLLLALGRHDIRSATLTWNGSISTDWNNPTNWTPQQVPTVSDHVVINSGSVTIPAEGVFAIMDWTGGEVDGALTVASNGVLNVNLGDRSVWTASLTNWGTIHWSDSQTWWLYGGAIYNQPGALIDMQGNGYLDYELNSEVVVNNGTFRKSAGSGNTVINVPFVNGGKVEAQTGNILFQRGYSGGPSATLSSSLGGVAPGTGYGKISFSSPPTFDGTFTVRTRNGYLPNPGATFQVLSYPSSTNSFTCLSGLDLGGGILLQPQFGPTGLTLLATAYITNASLPQLFINRTLGGLAIIWPVGFPGWTLQSNTNLSSPAWVTMSNACGNQAIVPGSAAQQYFRLTQ